MLDMFLQRLGDRHSYSDPCSVPNGESAVNGPVTGVVSSPGGPDPSVPTTLKAGGGPPGNSEKESTRAQSTSNPFPSFPPSSSLLLLLPTTYYSMSLPIMCCIIIKSGARQFATGDRHHLQLLQQQQRATPNQFCVLNTSIRGAAVVAPSLLFSLLVVIQIHVLWC